MILNGAMLSVSDKYDLVNERTQVISELMNLHIQGMWQIIIDSRTRVVISYV